MSTAAKPNQQEEILGWLESRADSTGLNARFHRNLVREEDNWLYVPVNAPGESIVDMANKLQELEDKWRDQEPEPDWQVLLIPAAD